MTDYLTIDEINIKAVARLLDGTGQSLGFGDSGHGACKYRSDDGLSCVVGEFIPDSHYDENMENQSARTLFQEYPEAIEAAGLENTRGVIDTLIIWQMRHDRHEHWQDTKYIGPVTPPDIAGVDVRNEDEY